MAGEIVLDKVLVGKRDRMVENVKFTVFSYDAETSKTALDEGELLNDIVLGMLFLNSIQAMGLTQEYTGSVDAGVRPGLDVIVQRAFQAESQPIPAKENVGFEHDEL